MFTFLDKNKSIKPQRKTQEEEVKRHRLHKMKGQADMKEGLNLEDIVELPDGHDKSEWLAIHAIDFYNKTNLIVGALKDSLKKNRDRVMKAGGYEYRWRDNDKYKKPELLPAVRHIRLTMEYIEGIVSDPSIFPEDDEGEFPKNFKKLMKDVFKRLFRVYAHLLYEYFDEIQKMGIEQHMSTTLKHFVLFTMKFKMLKKIEYEPLNEWIITNCGKKFQSKLTKKK